MTTLSSWAGTGAGLIVIGACIVSWIFVGHTPAAIRPWLHRLLIVGMYCGATAVVVTPLGTSILRLIEDILSWFGGVGTGIGHVAITITAWFLLLSALIALYKLPDAGAGILVVVLVFTLVLLPGGLHGFYTVTSVPGQQLAARISALMGGT